MVFARIERNKYNPPQRPFNPETDYRYRVVYPNLKTGGIKKENCSTREDAERRKTELNDLYDKRPQLVKHQDFTINHAVDLLEQEYNRQDKSIPIATFRLIREKLGNKKIRKLSNLDILDFKNIVVKKGVSPRTVNGYLGDLRTALEYSRREGCILHYPNIAKYIDSHLNVVRDRVLTPNEFLRLILACRVKISGKRRLHLIPYLFWLYETGMRSGELGKVRIRDIDIRKGVVRVWNGKSKKQKQRECGISPRLEKLIIKSGTLHRPADELLFAAKRWQKCWETARKLSGLEDIRIHDLRRTAITRFLENGLPIELVAKMVGHSAASAMTLDVYTRFRTDYIKEQMQKMK